MTETVQASKPWTFRPAGTAELGYVWDALSKQLARHEHARWNGQAAALGYPLAAELVAKRERTLARYLLAESHCIVAVPADGATQELVCGFAVYDPLIFTVHYVYVGRNLRRMGIARQLLAHVTQSWEAIYASHITKSGAWLLSGAHLTARYDPYRAFFSRRLFLRTPDGKLETAAEDPTESTRQSARSPDPGEHGQTRPVR